MDNLGELSDLGTPSTHGKRARDFVAPESIGGIAFTEQPPLG